MKPPRKSDPYLIYVADMLRDEDRLVSSCRTRGRAEAVVRRINQELVTRYGDPRIAPLYYVLRRSDGGG